LGLLHIKAEFLHGKEGIEITHVGKVNIFGKHQGDQNKQRPAHPDLA